MKKKGKKLLSIIASITMIAQICLTGVTVTVKAETTSIFTDYLPTITQVTDAAGFTHPSVGLTKELLENVRTKVRAGVDPWNYYFNSMLVVSPDASKTIGSNNSGDGKTPSADYYDSQGIEARFIADAIKAYSQAMMYYITGDEVYRANGMMIIRIWEQMDPAKYKYYVDACIHAAVPLYRMTMAAEILRYTSCKTEALAWTEKDTTDFTNNLIVPVTETFLHDQNHFMNQHNYPVLGAMAGYIFTGNRERYNEDVEWFTVNATANDQGFNGSVKQLFRWVTEEQQPGIKVGEGTQIAEPHVQQMEMGRDQAHGGGDLTNSAMITRLILAQGTKLDPVKGTPSTADNAVGPMEFLNDRILAAADYFWHFMLGYDTVWTPQAYAITGGDPNNGGMGGYIRDTYNFISGAYKGRFATANFWDFYSYYTYVRHEDVSKIAPYYYEAFTKKLTPDPGGWHNMDAGNDFWLYLPAEAEADADKFIPQNKSAGTFYEVEDRYTNLTKLDQNKPAVKDNNNANAVKDINNIDTTAVTTMAEGDTSFVRLNATEAGAKIVVLSAGNNNTTVELRIRTNGVATLNTMGQSVSLPDTKGEWKYYPITGYVGDFDEITAIGAPGTTVDIDHINYATLTPPVFKAGSSDMKIYTYVGASVNVDFSATDAGSTDVIAYEAQNNPAGSSIDANTGTFSWQPTEGGNYTLIVTATDGTAIAAKKVNIIVGSDRASAVQAITASYDSNQVYESATLNNYQTIYNDTINQISTASDEVFDKQLQALRTASEGLRLATPLAQDGTLRWSSVAVYSSWGSAATYMDDCSKMTGGGFGLALGSAPDTLHHIIDFGPDYKVSATKFGFQSNIFADRLANSTVYGSNDGETWTRLTPGVTAYTQAYNTLDVDPAYQNMKYRYIKLQMIKPLPDVLYGIPNRFLELQEFRIYGTRYEIGNKIQTVSMNSDKSFMGRIVLGNTVKVSITAKEAINNVKVKIQGQDAVVTTTDNINWTATATMTSKDQLGSVKITVDYQKQDGTNGDTLYGTTDNSKLFVADESDIINNVTSITNLFDPTTTWGRPNAAETLKQANMYFDNDITTVPHFFNGSDDANAYITFDFKEGNQALLSSVEVIARQDFVSRAGGVVVQGSNDNSTWTTISTAAKSVPEWQLLKINSTQAYRYIRLYNPNKWCGNLAEVKFHGVVNSLSKIASASISSPQSNKGRIVPGDTVKLAISAKEPIKNVKVNIHGQEAALSSTDNINWIATTIMKQGAESGNVKFTINYDQQDGAVGFPITTTTDNSKLYFSNTSDVINNVTSITNLIDSTVGRNAAETLKQTNYMFDGVGSSCPHYYTGTNNSGWGGYITFDFKAGSQVILTNAEVLGRQAETLWSRIGGTVVQGSNDNITFTTISTTAASTPEWQNLSVNSAAPYRYIRIFNGNNWYGNVAEVVFHGKVISPLKDVLNQAEALDKSIYTAESLQLLEVAVTVGKELQNNTSATQTQIDAAVSSILAAINGMQYIPGMPVFDNMTNQTVVAGNKVTFTAPTVNAQAEVKYGVVNLPSGATFDAATQTFEWTPAKEQGGIYNVTFTAAAGDLASSKTINIKVIGQPVINTVNAVEVIAEKLFTYQVQASEPSGLSLEYTADNLPAGAMLNPTSGVLSWTPAQADYGTHSITLKVNNGSYSASQKVDLNVVLHILSPESYTKGSYYLYMKEMTRIQEEIAKPEADKIQLAAEIAQAEKLLVKVPLSRYSFDGNTNDTYGESAIAFGTSSYQEGKVGQAINLNGSDSYLKLPDASALSNDNEVTIATWVNWRGGNQWQRIFDFGNNTNQYLFLTPRSGNNTLRFAIKNGGGEQYIQTSQLPSNQWVHLAVTLGNGTAKLYVNGELKATGNMSIKPSDFKPSVNYIGKSQWPDPLFNGMIDEFNIYNYALSADEVKALSNNMKWTDKSLLTIFLDKATEVVAAQYTTESFAIFQTAYENAKAVAANVNATQAEIDAASSSLDTALNGLAYDTTAPVDATLSADRTAPTNSDVTVTINYPADAVVKEYKVGDSGTWTEYTEPVVVSDNTTVYARGADAAGNVSNVTSYTVSNIDKTAPVTVANVNPEAPNGSNDWYKSDVTVSLSAKDNLSGLSSTEYSLDGGKTWLDYTAPVTVSKDEKYVLAYRSKDNAGNVEAAKTISFNLDATAPEITVTGFGSGSLSDASDIVPEIKLNDNLSGVDSSKIQVTLDGKEYKIGDTIQLYMLPLGEHTFIVNVSDLAGNKTSNTVTFNTFASVDGMKQLVTRFASNNWIDNAGIASSLQDKLQSNEIKAFIQAVQAQSGKLINNEAVGYLLRDANALLP